MRLAFLGDGRMGHVRRWVSYFQGRGHEVLLLSFEDPSGSSFPHRRMRGRLPTMTLAYLSGVPAIRRELARFRPDLVNALYAGGYGTCAALSGYPFVVSALGSDLLIDYPNHPLHRLMIRSNLRKARLVTTDAEILSTVVRDAGVPEQRILKAHFGVDPDIFHPPPNEATRAKPARVISTRNLHPVYGLEDLISAAAVLSGLRFDLCGEGPDRARLTAQAEATAPEAFRFHGKLDAPAVAELLRAATVYVSTSRSDSTSVSLLEAMACGTAPVLSDIPANHEWIEEGVNGLYYPAGDAAALGEAVSRLLEDDSLRASFRKRNLEIIRERGLWQPNMRRVETAFQKLAMKA